MAPLFSLFLIGPVHLDPESFWLGTFLVLYVGPDQILPLTSALGAIAGFLMIFWQRVVGIVRRMWHFFDRK